MDSHTLRTRPRRRNYVGQTFGRWTVIAPGSGRTWICRCSCGQEKEVHHNALRSGNSRSCGCLRRETDEARSNRATRNHVVHKLEYQSWFAMIQRCTNPKNKGYARYGGRGIKVCERWKTFTTFLADVGPRPTPQHTIDRFPDKDGDYEPSNVRWATPTEQANNKDATRILTVDGVSMSIAQWAKKTGISRATIQSRLYVGASNSEALSREDFRFKSQRMLQMTSE